jgi:hypothetical protein
MSATLTATAKLSLESIYNPDNTGISSIKRLVANNGGANGAVIPDVGIATGTGTALDANGNIQANVEYVFQGTITAGATKSINLKGGSDTDINKVALDLTKVKYFLVTIIDPDGVNKVTVGPQAIDSSWQGPWAGLSGINVNAYAGGTTYAEGDVVVDSGVYYESLADSNTGNTPASSPSDWSVIGPPDSWVQEDVTWRREYIGPAAGHAVSSGDLFNVTNPGASDLDVLIVIIGV